MRPEQLIIRCYAVRKRSCWVAFCLDLTLAAQGETFEQAKASLDAQIREYVHDALAGEDRPHAPYLLSRRAPVGEWIKYYAVRALAYLQRRSGQQRTRELFQEVVPVVPALC